MIDRIKKLNSAHNNLHINNTSNKRASIIFKMADKDNNGIMSNSEALAFGFTTICDKSLTQKQFTDKYNQFLSSTSSLRTYLKPFENIFYNDTCDKFIHDVQLSLEQQKELLSRLEMFVAYFSSLTPEEKDELMQIKSDMMCMNWFRDDMPIPNDYELPDDKKTNPPGTKQKLPDYKYLQIKDFFKNQLRGLMDNLKKGEMNNISNAMLAKYLKFATVNELDSDGKIGGFRQGSVGDCWFCSNIVNYTSSVEGEKNLKNRIKKNKDGSYSVVFNNPFEQTKKEIYNVTSKELENYRRISKISTRENEENETKMLSSGDIDLRILEVAANKLLEKYLNSDQIFRKNDSFIEGSSYIKESIIHKALGYTENIKYYIVDTDKTSTNYEKIVTKESNIILNKEGKAQTIDDKQSVLPFDSLFDVIKHYNFKENELTCGALNGRKAKELEKKTIFIKSKHGYNISKIVNKGLIVNNPGYAGFPHFIKKDLLNGDFFDILIHLPQNKLISVSALKD